MKNLLSMLVESSHEYRFPRPEITQYITLTTSKLKNDINAMFSIFETKIILSIDPASKLCTITMGREYHHYMILT